MKKFICVIAAALTVCMCFASCSDKKSAKEDKKIETVTKQTKIPKDADSDNTEKSESVANNTDEEKADVQNEVKEPENKTAEQPVQNNAETAKPDAKTEVDLSRVRSAILQKEGISDAMLLDGGAMSNLYGIDASQIKQAAGFVTMSGTFPHEIIMIEASDSNGAANVEAALKTKLGEVMNQARSYDAENYELAQQCKVHRNGNYVSLFLSPKQAEMTSIYNGYIK